MFWHPCLLTQIWEVFQTSFFASSFDNTNFLSNVRLNYKMFNKFLTLVIVWTSSLTSEADMVPDGIPYPLAIENRKPLNEMIITEKCWTLHGTRFGNQFWGHHPSRICVYEFRLAMMGSRSIKCSFNFPHRIIEKYWFHVKKSKNLAEFHVSWLF
jgi:hypothetical protein